VARPSYGAWQQLVKAWTIAPWPGYRNRYHPSRMDDPPEAPRGDRVQRARIFLIILRIWGRMGFRRFELDVKPEIHPQMY